MHIPDGYLSPSTCAVLYCGAGAGWYVSLRRMKHNLNARMVPLISVFAAFSFVVMLFNLPLPGGTTGHALGVTIAAIVLGPSGAILATSLAIAIQALFFGDGGITTLGANCFNMAVVGSLVAYVTYRTISANAALPSRRRVMAAAIAGYVAVNAAAFFTAIEFGIQPILFHDSRGVPLYAPYSLGVAVPAMMIGHLAIAGVAEAAISAGLVAYLQSWGSGAVARDLRIGSRRRFTAACAAWFLAKALDHGRVPHVSDASRHSGCRYSVGRMVRVALLRRRRTRRNRRLVGQSAASGQDACRTGAIGFGVDSADSGLCAPVYQKHSLRISSLRRFRSWPVDAVILRGAGLLTTRACRRP